MLSPAAAGQVGMVRLLCQSGADLEALHNARTPLEVAEARNHVNAMQTLKQEVAGNGCTLVITIHQPSPKVYTLFDSLIILFRGRLAYFGAAGDAPVKCFGEQGFPYETGFSTCEYLLDCLNQEARGETGHSFTQAYHESPQCKFNVEEARKALEAGPRKPEKQEPKKRAAERHNTAPAGHGTDKD